MDSSSIGKERSMTSHPDVGKTRGTEGERRSDMLRLQNSVREMVEETPGIKDDRGVVVAFRRLSSCLFSMLLRCLINRNQTCLLDFVSDRSNNRAVKVSCHMYYLPP